MMYGLSISAFAGLLAQAEPALPAGGMPGPSPWLLFLALAVVAIPAIWLFWQRRGPGTGGSNKLLHIQESCMVGPRQFVVVAAYAEERVLLAVSPGRIDFMCKLGTHANPEAEGTTGIAADPTAFSRLLDKDSPA